MKIALARDNQLSLSRKMPSPPIWQQSGLPKMARSAASQIVAAAERLYLAICNRFASRKLQRIDVPPTLEPVIFKTSHRLPTPPIARFSFKTCILQNGFLSISFFSCNFAHEI